MEVRRSVAGRFAEQAKKVRRIAMCAVASIQYWAVAMIIQLWRIAQVAMRVTISANRSAW